MSTPLRDALSRLRLRREISLAEMAKRLGLSAADLSRIEAGRRLDMEITDPAVLDDLETYGAARGHEHSHRIEETPVPLPDGFEDAVSLALDLDEDERRILAEGIAGRCEPPFPTDEELELLRSRVRRAPR